MQLHLPFSEDRTTAFVRVADSAAAGTQPDGTQVPPWRFDNGTCVFVRQRRARRYILRLDHEGRVRITIPRGGSRREATDFAERHREWIVRERARVMRREAPRTAGPEVLARAQATLSSRLLDLAAQHRLTVTRVSIRDQRTRWGSCGRDGHICLNWRLLLMPGWVSDYVLIHELMHLRRMDHSAAYWRLVASACPEYETARQWLRANGSRLR
jgi:predicted metal-dependent hydrolase